MGETEIDSAMIINISVPKLSLGSQYTGGAINDIFIFKELNSMSIEIKY